MAKLKGFNNLKKTIQNVSEKQFKAKVKKFVDSVSNLKSKLVKEQQRRLMNRNINDGITAYPHRRTGNLMRNLIDIKVESYRPNGFKKKGKYLTYTHSTTNMLDGGEKGITVWKVYKGKRYKYAEILQNSDKLSKWNGYYQRLQAIFKENYLRSVSRIMNKI